MATRMRTALVNSDVRAEEALVRSYAGFLLQFIFSSGILATLYSRCSLTIVQTVRFFCIISSSRSLSPASHDSYHANSQSHVNGLSGKYVFYLVLDRIHFIVNYTLLTSHTCPLWCAVSTAHANYIPAI